MGKNISEVTNLSIEKTKEFCSNLKFEGNAEIISKQILKEINERLDFY